MKRHYPESLAADWDAVGLVCGDPAASVARILLAVDPVPVVVDEALVEQADMVITHHPLFLHGVHSVSPETARGSVVHTLITHGKALYCAHTNADHASPGVSDALALALGISIRGPITALGENSREGIGRVGVLSAPVPLQEFAAAVDQALPATAHGIRVAGDLRRPVQRIAVCGGSGDSLLDELDSDIDVYVTSDLRHHRAQDFMLDADTCLIDIPHWAGEWIWLNQAADLLREDLHREGAPVEIRVSGTPTSPWVQSSPVATSDISSTSLSAEES
jgi:dinuclear metal center YbgI/SA1388 family protein